MSAHSDPLQYYITDRTAGGRLREIRPSARMEEKIPPFGNPPFPEMTGGRTQSVPTVMLPGLEEGPDGRDAGGVRPPSRDKTPKTIPAAGTGFPSGCRAVHTFNEQLRAGTLGPCQLASLFRQTVPGYEGHKVATLAQDKDGVDFWLAVTGEPRLVPCQLKVRPYRKKLTDVLFEVCHIGPRRVWPGWIQDRPARVFLYYLPTPKRCLVCNGHELAAAWRKHGLAWADRFGVRLARNADYTTVSVPVPVAEVLTACPSGRVVEARA